MSLLKCEIPKTQNPDTMFLIVKLSEYAVQGTKVSHKLKLECLGIHHPVWNCSVVRKLEQEKHSLVQWLQFVQGVSWNGQYDDVIVFC